ncbi:hypothetical protein NITMOv2_0281 [Nitrospira moscoviensis]|uniref:Uncharacterized protein n=1 Tax=Nitrospira moscoviensis TaxID=42253 RepID=A0A0K2G710_NITMO|nr:hypothetical protein NITMOv2_0281 [Nitrospira moscoviensis]
MRNLYSLARAVPRAMRSNGTKEPPNPMFSQSFLGCRGVFCGGLAQQGQKRLKNPVQLALCIAHLCLTLASHAGLL